MTERKSLKDPSPLEWITSKIWRLSQSIQCRLYNLRNPLPQETKK